MIDNYNLDIFKENVRFLRIKAKLTQRTLADNLGCSNAMICDIEKGRSIPKMDFVINFCNFFGVDMNDLFLKNLIEVMHI